MTTIADTPDADYPLLVACVNANGESDVFVVMMKQSDVDPVNHQHINKAIELAEEAGYEWPLLVFEGREFDYMRAALKEVDSSSVPAGH